MVRVEELSPIATAQHHSQQNLCRHLMHGGPGTHTQTHGYRAEILCVPYWLPATDTKSAQVFVSRELSGRNGKERSRALHVAMGETGSPEAGDFSVRLEKQRGLPRRGSVRRGALL